MSSKRKTIIIGFTVVGFFFLSWFFITLSNNFFPRGDVPTIEESGIIAKSWIMNHSTTYPYYGRDLNLIKQEEIERGEYKFVFSFTTERPGFGIFENEMVVLVDRTEVVSAITDEIFDEIKKAYIKKEELLDLFFVLEGEVSSIQRGVPVSVVENAQEVLLKELLKGPTEDEIVQGYTTEITENTEFFSFRVEGGVAYVELSIPLEQQTSLAREQIKETLVQFENISSVERPRRARVITVVVDNVPEGFFFEVDLEEGDEKIDVKYLQKILNADPETVVADSGPGSPGAEIEIFNEETTQAVRKFQMKYSDEVLRPAGKVLSDGVVDEHTRDKLNAILEENRL